ncbi:helix-turn-helix transcriptional regulator [Altererythrobacter sp. C41]|nr:helix-turn-helix domain-containing protein [Altererythrobacter sp. C41]MBM0169516.1 helix-turn-helix transcriptional regulator [Altererythrobacter sp. C41]
MCAERPGRLERGGSRRPLSHRARYLWKSRSTPYQIARRAYGITSTEVAEQTDTMPNNTSVHLSVLRNAGLVSSTKEGRSVTYRAERGALRNLATFLSEAAK